MLHLKRVGGIKTFIWTLNVLHQKYPYEFIECEIVLIFPSPSLHRIYVIFFLIVLNVNKSLIQFSHGMNTKKTSKGNINVLLICIKDLTS